MNSGLLSTIRKRLDLSQEQMARILGVSFVSVNRWEGGRSSPSGPTLDLYAALDAAIRAGHSATKIKGAANNERSAFLCALFQMAYTRPAKKKAG